MPNLEEHCKHSLKRYGVEGGDIHIWLDEPSRHYAGIHREFRHDEKTIILAGETFGKIYGEDKAQAIALDHIMADHEESIKKRREKNGVALSEIKAYEEEKSKYEKKKEELKKLIKDESELPEIKTGEMRDFLDRFYSDSPDLKKLAETAQRHWQQYVLSRENPNREIEKRDITGFVSNLLKKGKRPRTISHYLGRLVVYFNHVSKEELADYIDSEKKKFGKIAEAEKNTTPMRHRDVIRLYQSASLEDKILIRLLLLEKLPNSGLGKIFVRQDSKGEYDFTDGKQIISINEETVKIAKPLIQENILKGGKKLLRINTRQIQNHIHDAGKKIGLPNNVSPKDLRKFGKNHHPDDLMEMLSTATKPS